MRGEGYVGLGRVQRHHLLAGDEHLRVGLAVSEQHRGPGSGAEAMRLLLAYCSF